MVMIVPDARVALCSAILGVIRIGHQLGCLLFRIVGGVYIGATELFAEVDNELGGYLWHCIENDIARAAVIGVSLGE